MKTTLFLILTLATPFAAPLAAQGEGEGTEPPNARTALERGAFAEEYERDLARAEGLYTQAEEVARAQGDETTAKAAAAALARVRARQAGAPAAAASSQDEAIVERIGELLYGLSTVQLGIDHDHPGWANYQAITTDLAVYGDAVVPWLEQLLQPTGVEIGAWRVTLDTRMAARRLAALNTEVANAALARALQAKDPLIRRAVAEELSPFRHKTLLEQAARDSVPQVRSVAVGSLIRLQLPEHLALVEPEALLGNRDAVRWMVRVTPERVLVVLQEGLGSSGFRTRATDELRSAELPPTTETIDALLRLARELEQEEQRSDVLSAIKTYLGDRNRTWSDLPSGLRAHVQAGLLAAPEAYPRQAASELLAEVGDFGAFAHLSRELTSWPADRSERDTQWLQNATRSLGKRLEPNDFDALAELYGELPLNPEVPVGTLPLWHGDAVTRLAEFAETGTVSAEAVARGYPSESGVVQGSYFWVVEAWIRPRQAKPESEPGFSSLVPILRAMLEQGRSGSSSRPVAALALARGGDFESLARIVAYTESGNNGLKNSARDAMRRFYQLDAERTVATTVEVIQAEDVGPNAITMLGTHELEAFQAVWPGLAESQRATALSTLVLRVEDPEANAVIAELYPMMQSAPTRKNAIARFGNYLYEPAVPILGQALEDPEQSVRGEARTAFQKFKSHREALEEFAAWSLGDRQARQQIDELIELLASDDSGVVLGAVKALGAVRGRAALPELVRLLERDDEALSQAVYEAIEKIGS